MERILFLTDFQKFKSSRKLDEAFLEKKIKIDYVVLLDVRIGYFTAKKLKRN